MARDYNLPEEPNEETYAVECLDVFGGQLQQFSSQLSAAIASPDYLQQLSRDAWDAWRDFSQPLSDVVGCSSQLQASAAPDVVGCASQLEASGASTPLSSQVLESAVRMSAEYHGFPGKLVDTVVDQPVIHSAANNVSAELLASAKDSVAYMRKHQQLVQEL